MDPNPKIAAKISKTKGLCKKSARKPVDEHAQLHPKTDRGNTGNECLRKLVGLGRSSKRGPAGAEEHEVVNRREEQHLLFERLMAGGWGAWGVLHVI
jgi:hypothetical protein